MLVDPTSLPPGAAETYDLDGVLAAPADQVLAAQQGVTAELRLSQSRVDLLQSQLANARQRLDKLANMRADYSNLVAERNQRSDILKSAPAGAPKP